MSCWVVGWGCVCGFEIGLGMEITRFYKINSKNRDWDRGKRAGFASCGIWGGNRERLWNLH